MESLDGAPNVDSLPTIIAKIYEFQSAVLPVKISIFLKTVRILII